MKKLALASLAASLFAFSLGGIPRVADARSRSFVGCSGNLLVRVTIDCERVAGGEFCTTTYDVVGSCSRGNTSGPM